MALCQKCSLVQQVDLPTDEELRIYYSHNYREDYKSTHKPKTKYVYRAGQTAVDRLELMARAGLRGNQKLLDIGAGGGEFVYMARKAGFDSRGIEPHRGYSEFAREEYAVCIDTQQIWELEDGQLDVVTMFHVLEHLAHPGKVMEKVHGLLAEGGHFVVEVPNIVQKDASPHNIYFKAHLFYYSRPSLIAAASQFFEPVYIEDTGNLSIVFRRRANPLAAPVLPEKKELEFVQARLAQKGWREYLFEGGGLTKAFKRLGKITKEGAVKSMQPRPILDLVFNQRGKG